RSVWSRLAWSIVGCSDRAFIHERVPRCRFLTPGRPSRRLTPHTLMAGAERHRPSTLLLVTGRHAPRDASPPYASFSVPGDADEPPRWRLPVRAYWTRAGRAGHIGPAPTLR